MKKLIIILLFPGLLMAQDLQDIFAPLSNDILYDFVDELSINVKTKNGVTYLTADLLYSLEDIIWLYDINLPTETFSIPGYDYLLVSDILTSLPENDYFLLDGNLGALINISDYPSFLYVPPVKNTEVDMILYRPNSLPIELKQPYRNGARKVWFENGWYLR